MRISGRTFSVTRAVCLFSFLGLFFSPSWALASATDMMGADRMIAEITEAMSTPPVVEQALDPRILEYIALQHDVEEFRKTGKSMTPEQAAETWLSLMDRYFDAEPLQGDVLALFVSRLPENFKIIGLNSFFEAMPGPDSWSHLKKLVESRGKSPNKYKDVGLRMLTCYLAGDIEGLKMAGREFIKSDLSSGSQEKLQIKMAFEELFASVADLSPSQVISSLERIIKLQRANGAGDETLNLPDLLSLTTREKAASIIREALKIKGVVIEVSEGEETRKLAGKIVLEQIKTIDRPQWALVKSIGDVPLFLAMKQRFPRRSEAKEQEIAVEGSPELVREMMRSHLGRQDDSDYDNAQSVYISSLIIGNKIQEAVNYTVKLHADRPDSLENILDRSIVRLVDSPEKLFGYYGALLKKLPTAPVWDSYLDAACVIGKGDQAIAEAAKALAAPSLDLQKRVIIEEQLASAYLAMDRIEEGISVIRQILGHDVSRESPDSVREIERLRYNQAVKIREIGKALDDPSLVREGIEAFGRIAGNLKQESFLSLLGGGFDSSESVDFLIESGDYAQAEKVLLTNMQIVARLIKANSNECNLDNDSFFPGVLAKLAEIYVKTGRYQDVLTLLEKAPWWNAGDISAYLGSGNCGGGRQLPVFAAKALHELNRDEEAQAILKYHIQLNPEDDGAYSILADIGGKELVPWLDALYQRDQFQERPLIWKAFALKKQGLLEEAEQAARKSLEVDPTDGEQKAGRRIFSYVVLADILDARGKKDEADFLRKVVASVRLAEKGDEFKEVGLYTRSLAQYEKAEAMFPDAYCIQWRIAERLYSLGRHVEARKHYLKAFERMPDQFGRMASFCFGCEGAFEKKQSRVAAEEVLTRLEKASTPKPQVYFLLGLLRKEEGKYTQAYSYFRNAGEADNLYLDAWKEMFEIRDEVFPPQKEVEAIAFRLMEMDPAMNYSGAGIDSVRDVARLWKLLEQNQKFRIPKPDSLFPLTASRQKADRKQSDIRRVNLEDEMGYSNDSDVPLPGEAVLRITAVRHITNIMRMGHMNAFYFH